QYATARIRSIFRRADGMGTAEGGIAITAGPERALALKLLGFGVVLTGVGETAEPHRLCTYLFDVASLFTTFYEECPVLKAEPASGRGQSGSVGRMDTNGPSIGYPASPGPDRLTRTREAGALSTKDERQSHGNRRRP